MKIFSINPTLTTNQNYNKPTFKANPVVQRQINTIVSGEGRHVFRMLAGALGLSSIISWVKDLYYEEPGRVSKKLDAYNDQLTSEWNTLMLEKTNKALDTAFEIDSFESSIWTKGLISEVEDLPKNNSVEKIQKKMFFNPKAESFFMDISAEVKMKTIKRYVDAFLASTPEVQEKVLKEVETRFDYFIKLAKELKENKETSKLFDKISNIAKLYSLISLVKDVPEEEREVVHVKRQTERKERNIYEEQPISEGYSVKEQVAAIMKGNNKQDKIEPQEDVELSRKIFQERIVAGKNVRPYVYMPYYPLIKKIYDGVGSRIGSKIIDNLASADRSKSLALYNEYSGGEHKAFNYSNFMYLEEMKNVYRSSVTKEEFDKLNAYHETCVDFFRAGTPKDSRHFIEVKFKPEARLSLQERFKVILDIFQIAFNVSEEQIIKPYEQVDKIDKDKVIQEIVFRLSKQVKGRPQDEMAFHGYEKIMEYFGFDEKDIKNIRELVTERGYKTAETYVKDLIENKRCKTKINNLCAVLNNPAFDKYMQTPHVRMRFLERFVLNKENLSDSVKELKDATLEAINELEMKLYSQLKTKVNAYNVTKRDEEGGVIDIKYCPQIDIDGSLISINSEGDFHTIF